MISNNIKKTFTIAELETISKIIGDTYEGLTGSEISYFISTINISDDYVKLTKWKRVFNALVYDQNNRKTGEGVLTFITRTLAPTRYINRRKSYLSMIEDINKVLFFRGIEFREDGRFHKVKKVDTLGEAEERANKLKTKLASRNVHNDILRFCSAELVKDNYFHAVLEASKGIASRLRLLSGIDSDGSKLVDSALGGKNPIIKINSFSTESEKSEQKGFCNLVKGLFGMFRNPTAHEPKIEWVLSEDDALDIFVLTSLIMRKLDKAK